VVAVVKDTVLTEDGESMLLDQLVRRLPPMQRTLFAATNGADLLAYLDNIFAIPYPTTWQWRTSDISRDVPSVGTVRVRSVTVAVQWFGFRGNGHKGGIFHRLIDPVTMYRKSMSEIMAGDHKSKLAWLLKWAVTLRDWCIDNRLQISPTTGGIGAQLLTDPRFYPEARRKVPRQTNDRARDTLPGNHYCLEVIPSPEREYRVTYIDQHRAHHYHARLLKFPHANHLYALGNFHNLDKFYREQPSPMFMGLYCLDLLAPRFGKHYSWLKGNGILERQFVYTNELPHLLDMGYLILGVRAAWGSTHRDSGLNRLAAWACDQLDRHDNAPWLKPVLLSAYGCLACKGDHAQTVFRLARRGEETTIATGKRRLTGIAVKRKKLEPGITNVIHRGMIEAATRSESIGMAQHLILRGQRILQIYADAVLVEADDDRPLPLLPEPWEVKQTLNHYQPLSKQAFIADGMSRLPGVSHRDLLAYAERRTIGHQNGAHLSHLS